MGFMDKIKGLAKGKNAQMHSGTDKAEQMVKGRVDDKYDSKIDAGTTKAHETIDRIDPKRAQP